MSDYLTDFVQDSQEQITTLNNSLLTLERSPDDEEAMKRIFRAAHTLKGNCGAMGFDRASDLAHAIEDLLDVIRAGDVEVSPGLMDTIFDGVDELEAMIDEAGANGEIRTDPTATIEALRARIDDASGPPELSTPTDEEIDAVLERLEPPADDDHDAYFVRLSIDEAEGVNNGLLVVEALRDAFDVIGTDPPRGAIEAGEYEWTFDAVFASPVNQDAIAAALEPVDAVLEFEIAVVTDRLEAVAADVDADADAEAAEAAEDPNDLTVDELLDEVSEFDDLDAMVEEVEDVEAFEDMGDAGSFDDLLDDEDVEELAPETAVEEAEASDDDADEPAADEPEQVDDAGAVFAELQDEVEMVGFDELQDELDELEFDEFSDEDELSMEELLGDDVDLEDESFLEDQDDGVDEPLFEDDEPLLEDDSSLDDPGAAEADEPGFDDEEPAFGEDEPAFDDAVAVEDSDFAEDVFAIEGDEAAPAEPSAADEGAASAEAASAEAETDDVVEPADTDDVAESVDTDDIDEPTDTDDVAESVDTDDVAESVDTDDVAEPAEEATDAPAESDAAAEPDHAEVEAFAFDERELDDEPTASAEAAESASASDDEPETVETEAFADEVFGDDGLDEAGLAAEADEFADEVFGSAGFDSPDPRFEDTVDVEDGSFADASADSFDPGTDVDDEFGSFDDDVPGFETPSAEFDPTDGLDESTADADGFESEADDAYVSTPEDIDFDELEADDEDGPSADDGDDGIQSVRVGVDQIDALLTLVEGLVTSRVRLRHAIETGADLTTIDRELDDLEDLTTDLQETVMDVRLVPLETAVNRLPRVVRDISREQDKQVVFEMDGEDVELDRTILDEIGDPLIHMVRNAVDHGIEPPEEREAAGKPPEGTVELRAERSNDRVTIEIEDDGAGLDPDRLRDEAVDAGVLSTSEAEALPDEEAYELVFHSGLSTAEEVTDISGRGVGMDVVKQTIDDLEGTVSVDSEPGEGTTVTLSLPVTMAIEDVLFVESGGEEFGVPTKVVGDVETVSAVEVDEERGVLEVDGAELSIVDLAESLGTAGGVNGDGMFIRIRDDVRPVAIHCDEIRGQQEVVVKPFEGFMSGIPGLSGATVRGRGEVVNILDVTSL